MHDGQTNPGRDKTQEKQIMVGNNDAEVKQVATRAREVQ